MLTSSSAAEVLVSPRIQYRRLASPDHLPDGSIMAHTDVEIQYAANNGLDEIIEEQRPFALKHNVSFGDL